MRTPRPGWARRSTARPHRPKRRAVLVIAVLAAVRARAEPVSMPVVVVETSTTVEFRVRVGKRIDPGSVEVEIAGRTVTVRAREAGGERLYERRFILHEPVTEERATAEYDRAGWLTVVLRKQSAPPPE